MKKFILITLLFTGSFTINELVAQPPGGGGGAGGGSTPNCFPPPCVPIDGGLSFLLIAGTVYGGKKVLEMSKSDENID